MLQHASTYHFDRLKFLLLFTALVPLIWIVPGKAFKIATVIFTIVASTLAVAGYNTARFYADIPIERNALFLPVIDMNNGILATKHPVRGFIVLAFGQNVHQEVSITQAAALAVKKQQPVFWLDADMVDNEVLRMQGVYRFEPAGNVTQHTLHPCNEYTSTYPAFSVVKCEAEQGKLFVRTLVTKQIP